MSRRILVIEDNTDLARLLEIHLQDLSYIVDLSFEGDKGLYKAESGSYDLIILDIMLPGVDGIEICRRLRSRSDYTPILMLTSKSSELDRVLGLEIGADDYVTKPFSIRELMARVKALFRRVDELKKGGEEEIQELIQAKDLTLDLLKRKVTLKDRVIDLTAKEFDLLVYFAKHPGRAYTREQLLNDVWGYGHDGYEHTVNSHINRLRAKIEANPAKPQYVLTVWGVGYKFTEI
jgi:DNA-binding response OmpR family regulator